MQLSLGPEPATDRNIRLAFRVDRDIWLRRLGANVRARNVEGNRVLLNASLGVGHLCRQAYPPYLRRVTVVRRDEGNVRHCVLYRDTIAAFVAARVLISNGNEGAGNRGDAVGRRVGGVRGCERSQ